MTIYMYGGDDSDSDDSASVIEIRSSQNSGKKTQRG